MIERETFSYDVEQLLVPIPGDVPAGPSMLFDAAFGQIRQAREEDDPTLPMGEWERPLKKADWRAVTNLCIALLSGKTKDLQVAAWLCEAWTQQHQMAGFIAGTRLLTGLVERFWDTVHPQIEDGDADARTAPFFWMNESLSVTLRLRVPLFMLPDYRPSEVNLVQWERSLTAEPAGRGDDNPEHLSRDQLIALADGNHLHGVAGLADELEVAFAQWDALSRLLDEKLALDAPGLGKVSDVLRKLQRACAVLLEGRDPRHVAPPVPAPAAEAAHEPQPEPQEVHEMNAPAAADSSAGEPGALAMPSGPITSRAEAYRMLEAAAAYLQRTEPHSPTPYLVKRAVSWGNMSLADLMQEILREEGDLTRYFSLLGLNPPRG